MRPQTTLATATANGWTRREFLKSGGGLALGFLFAGDALLSVRAARADEKGFSANAWVHIAPDGTITIQCPSSEMGQGIMTSLPLVLAEELVADWSKVKVAQAPASKAYINPLHFNTQGVGGSRSTRGYWLPMRLAGAQTRQILMANAATRWNVPREECTTEPSRVVHQKSGRSMSYGEIAAFGTVPSDLPQLTAANLSTRKDWRLIGRDVPRVDIPAKVDGSAKYAMDVMLPGMLYASILRPPFATFPHPQFSADAGIRPIKIDDRDALAIEGVTRIVPLDHGVAVIGTEYWSTVLGKRALKVEWQSGAPIERYNSATVLEEFTTILRDPSRKGEIRATGDIDAAFRSAASVMSAEFQSEHVYHAAMEPFNAVAWMRGDELDLWCPTQGQLWAQEVAAKAAGTTPDKVRVHTPYVGGGFGLKTEQLINAQAAFLAKTMAGQPVKVIWSREDDMQNGAYRPATAQRVEAALSAEGRILGWRHRLVGDSIIRRARGMSWAALKGYDVVVMSGAATIYDIPAKHHEYIHENRGVAAGYWIANGAGYTKFAGETLIDEIAAKFGRDPLDFRLALLTNPRARAVLQAVAEMSDWRRKRIDRGLGIAYHDGGEWNTHNAQVSEVSVDRVSGLITVHRIWNATETGLLVQPSHVAQQMETGILFGWGSALRERITLQDGRVQQSNFADYPLPRLAELPEIIVKVIDGPEQTSGPSESGSALVAASVANAVAQLTGVRLRQLPMLPERVLAALAQPKIT